MKTWVFIMSVLSGLSIKSAGQNPKVPFGKLVRIENFQSGFVSPRNVDIWLPEGFAVAKKYGVLYMHDGQMLFDSSVTWNKQSWDVAGVATNLFRDKKIKDFIVVGIWNSGPTRHADYFPAKPFEKLLQEQKDSVSIRLERAGKSTGIFLPQSDNYLKFIVRELKPYIDNNYPVYTNRENTCIMGSSMGGLISVYAICEYPEVFGGAGCLSTHWTGIYSTEDNPFPDAMIDYLKYHLPDDKKHKIYFDYGDQTLDALYPGIQKKVDAVMMRSKFSIHNWSTRYFPGENHSELAWRRRLNIPLLFLFGK